MPLSTTEQRNLNNELLIAIQYGRTKVVRELIAQGANVKETDEFGYTPLHRAADAGIPDMIQAFIDAGADLEAKTLHGRTPLFLAVENKRNAPHASLQTLIAAGADVNTINNNNSTPLHRAITDGDAKIAQYLIESGADVDAANNDHNTPLHTAVKKRRSVIVLNLLVADSNVNAVNKERKTPIMLAFEQGAYDIVRLLNHFGAQLPENLRQQAQNDGIEISFNQNVHHESTDSSNTISLDEALGEALPTCNTRYIYQLMANGANVNAIDFITRNTHLHFAAQQGNMIGVQCLLEARAKVNEANRWGVTPIQMAFEKGHHDIVRLLQQHGAQLPKHLENPSQTQTKKYKP